MSDILRKLFNVFHGSPYAFKKFDPTKIGTGEGAQSFGYGHYFAGNEDVARGYRDSLITDKYVLPTGEIFSPDNLQHLNVRVRGRKFGTDLQRTLDEALRLRADSFAPDTGVGSPTSTQQALEWLQSRPTIDKLDKDIEMLRSAIGAGGITKAPGHMYEVDIHADPAKLLQQHVPFNEQGATGRQSFDVLRELDSNVYRDPDKYKDYTPDYFSWLLDPSFAKEAKAQGIPGMQYLDGRSRAAGEGSLNTIMFPGTEDLININRRYEQGGPVTTPTEGEGGLYAAPNSTFDTPPPYDWGYRPAGAHADGGPVEMGGGGLVERLARAAAQGFDVTKKWYHSAVEPIEQFQPHGQFMGRSGVSGIHLTDDPKVASRFLDRYGDYNYKGEPFAKNVMPLYVNPGRILERDERFPSALGMGFPLPENYKSPVEQLGYDSLLRNDAITGRGNVGHVDPSNRGRFDLPYRELVLHDPKRVRSIFDPFEDGFADGGPVEMATGGTTPTSTGGQYQPRESEGPGFFRNNDNYENSDAGGVNFVKNFVQGLSPAQREAQRLVSEATRKSGKEAVIFGRGDDPSGLTSLTHGNYDTVNIPPYYQQFAGQSTDPFFSLHSHPSSTLSPSTADLKLWGNAYPGSFFPYQSMLINASPQDSILRLGEPGKFMDAAAQSRVKDVLNYKRENDDLVSFAGYGHPRIQEFMRGNKLPDAAHLLHAEAQPMPGIRQFMDKKHPGVAQDVSMRDLYAGNFLQRIAERGIPVDVSAEHRIAGTPYLAQDVWPEFAAHVKKHNLKAEGGPVNMEKGGPLRKAVAAIKRLASDPAWDSAKANAAQYEIAGMGKGAGPLDLSDLDQRIPGILQEAIPRTEPPRGVSPRLQGALSNPQVLSGIEDSIRHGQTLGADKWYHNNPLYQAFVRELGPEQGHTDFMKYMDYQSASSPRSDVPTNIRNASYYFTNEGKDPRSWAEMPANPAPYGHLAQGLHRANADVVRANEGDWGGYDVFKNPKPPSYGTNLGGNLLPVALDSHAFKNIGMRSEDPRFLMTSLSDFLKVDPFSDARLSGADDVGGRLSFAQQYGTPGAMKDGKFRVDYKPQELVASGRLSMDEALTRPVLWDAKPRENEYGAGERLYQQMGHDMGMAPADAQSSAWAGAGKLTGLGTAPDKTFGQMHNERVLLTAKLRGEDPADTLRKLIRREAPLFAEGGTVEDQYHPIWQQSFAGGGQPDRPDKYDNAIDAMYPWLSMDASSLTPEPDRSYDSEPSGINTIEGNLADSLYGGRITPTAEERYDRRKSREAYRAEHPEGVYSTDPLRGILGMIGKQRAGWSADQAEQYPEESSGWQRAGDQLGHLGRTFAHDVTGGLSDKLVAALSSGDYPVNVSREAAATRSSRDQLDPYVRAPMSVLPYMLSPAQQLAQYGMTTASNLMEPAHGAIDWARKQFDKSMLGLARPVSEAVYGEMKPSFTRPQWDKGYGFDHGGPVAYAHGGHAKDTGNTFDFLGPFGAGLNLIADGAGAIFGGEDFELDKALGYLGEIGGSLVAPGIGGSLGRGAGTMAAHLIEPGEGGDIGQDALRAGYGALRGGAGMFFAHGGSTGFLPQSREGQDPNDLTRFLAPPINPSEQPDPMDWAAAGGIPGAISPPINANNGQMARDAAERERLMAQAQASSMKGLQSQSASGGGGGGSGIGGMLKTLAPFANFIPGIGPMVSMGMSVAGGMMKAEGGPVPAPDGQHPWMYGNGALMARGGYLRGCGGMNG